jgi:hypothetical protein
VTSPFQKKISFYNVFQKWTIHRGIRRKSGSPPRTTQNSDESSSQVNIDNLEFQFMVHVL